MEILASKKVEKKDRNKAEVVINKDKLFVEYMNQKKEINSVKSTLKKMESEIAPLDAKLREDALELMEAKGNFDNFNWGNAQLGGYLNIIMMAKFSKLDDSVIEHLKEMGYNAQDFIQHKYSIDNEALKDEDFLKDIKKLAEKYEKKGLLILERQLIASEEALDIIKEKKDRRLIDLLKPQINLVPRF